MGTSSNGYHFALMDSFIKLSINYPYIRVVMWKPRTLFFSNAHRNFAMVTRPIVVAVLCVGVFLILQSLLPKTMAFNSNIDRYMMEDQRTQRRKNYMVQRARNKDFLANPEGVITYENEPIDPDRNPDELSAFIVDYANMIRDDVILLDKSVETRTRKRGNIKVKNYNDNNQVILDPPCTCNYDTDIRDLGDNIIPHFVETRSCNRTHAQPGCAHPYKCQENMYDLPILRKNQKRRFIQISNVEGSEFIDVNCSLWYPDKLTISVGCFCIRDWKENTG